MFQQQKRVGSDSDLFSQEVMSDALRVSPGAPEHQINAPTTTLMDLDGGSASPIGE